MLGALLLASTVAACGRSAADGESIQGAEIARVGIALELTEQVGVDRATYTLSRPDGYRTSGPLPISEDDGRFTGLMLLPVGVGYELAASALTVTGAVCTGSTTFDIWADRKTAISLRLQCPTPPPPDAADAGGMPNLCPIAQPIIVQPAADADLQAFSLRGAAIDADQRPRALSYAWRTSSGVLTSTSEVETRFYCTEPGFVTATLGVSDGDFGCDVSVRVVLTCDDAAQVDAGAEAEPESDAGRDRR